MFHVTAQVKQAVLGNLGDLLEDNEPAAPCPAHIRPQLQDGIAALTSDFARARRRQARLDAEAARLAKAARRWSDKARVAQQKRRADLAEAAALTCRETQAQCDQARRESQAALDHARDVQQLIVRLEAKMAEVRTMAAPYGTRRGSA